MGMAWQSRSDPRRQFYWLPQLGSSTTVVFLHAFEQLKIAQNFTVRKHPEYLGFNWLFVCTLVTCSVSRTRARTWPHGDGNGNMVEKRLSSTSS